MSACRADRWSREKALRLVAAGLFVVVPLGAAHSQAPVPPSAFDPETMELAEPARPGGGAKIQTDTLKAPNPESVGVLDQRHGGLGDALWTGTPAMVARRLIPLLPASPGGQSVRDLERRLLLSTAPAPEGAAEGDRPSLVELRAERLLAMGDVDAAAALAQAAPASVSGPLLGRAKLEALLLAGNLSAACSQANSVAGESVEKLQVLCAFLAGKTLEGNLGLDLLRERKDSDAAFIAAAETLAGLPPMAPDKIKLDKATALHLAAFNAAKLPLPPASLAKVQPALARAVALSAAIAPELRLAAGEQAQAAGLLSPEDMRKLYLAQVFAADEMGAPLARAEGERGIALLFRAASDQPDPLLRAQYVAKALDLAAAKAQIPANLAAFAPLLAAIKPDPVLAPQAAAFARAHLAVGDQAAASPWLDLLKADPAAHMAERLWPLLAVQSAGSGQALSTTGLAGWRATLEGVAPEQAARRSAVVLGVLAGLGAKIPEAAWLDILDLPAGGPRPGLFALMQNGALEARLGTTLLASLAALGEQPLSKVDPITLSEAVSALAVVGLTDDSRKLAVEALLANGV